MAYSNTDVAVMLLHSRNDWRELVGSEPPTTHMYTEPTQTRFNAVEADNSFDKAGERLSTSILAALSQANERY